MSIRYYRDLLTQPQRLGAMREAIERVVTPGDVVVEVGTGLGTYAIWAARAGADRVFAIEPTRIAEVASRVIGTSGSADRIDLLHGRVEEIELPGRADVLITEDFAPWFYDRHLHDILLHVRDRLLVDGGRVVPARVTLKGAPWGGPAPEGDQATLHPSWKSRAGSGEIESTQLEGIDFSALDELMLNQPDPNGVPADGLLAAPCDLFDWDVTELQPGMHHARVEWQADRKGSAWGVGIWADFEFASGVTYSNAPGEPESSWGQGHFPIAPALEVESGSLITGDIETRSDPNGEVWWRWRVDLAEGRGRLREGNTFRALPIDGARIAAISGSGRIPLSRWAVVDAHLLAELTEHPMEEAVERTISALPEMGLDRASIRRRAGRLREPYIDLAETAGTGPPK